MILIKDRHLGEFHKLCPFSSKGTMILIKDRHISPNVPATNAITTGNYDTYKGSTPFWFFIICNVHFGNYDTYKGSTLFHIFFLLILVTREI